MSKYIKLEDALKGLNIGYGKYDYVSKVADYYNNLPTIEVSEDCISKASVVSVLSLYRKTLETKLGTRASAISDAILGIVDDCIKLVENAPSVVPSRAEGEWIGTEYDGYADGNPVFYEWICSACKCVVEDEEPTWNYCPNCGAKMKG